MLKKDGTCVWENTTFNAASQSSASNPVVIWAEVSRGQVKGMMERESPIAVDIQR